ncbi:histidine kinase [Amorphoplanes nipponensis]|uniref:histidine kinase n=1 Tax=Actinoplanes nipponensis TaxID=135950 RepID=A0A919MKI5_9ACTN|nr:hypothetical protein Ani05nite_20950 [Actinoplanes nipponensis]
MLPCGLAVAQLAAWPGRPLATGEPLPAAAVATGVAVTVVVAAALLWRRTAPPATLAVVVAALTVGTVGVSADALLVISVADLVALYGVAVWRSGRLALGGTAGVALWQCALIAATSGVTGEYPAEVASVVIVYPAVVAFGRARHRWHADRATAAARLAEAEDRRNRAADTERRRLARELHDVTAHHLTSIVVIVSAAQRLGAARPDLAAEARAFASRTGRDTLAALHRLVALLQRPDERPDPVAARLDALAEGFRLLGQRVGVQAGEAQEPPPAATEAVCGITREALTNILRYAPGAGVRIRLATAPAGLELTIDDDGARADGPGGLGSGRGVAGMRERATTLGGTLTAGPRPGGGWRVRAVLPSPSPAVLPPAAGVAVAAGRSRRRPGSAQVIDAALVLLALFAPAGGLLAAPGDAGPAGAPVPLLLLVAAAHAVPVGWRRRRPWTVLGAVAATAWILPVLIATGVIAPAHGWVLPAGLGAELIAVYAVARYARRHDLSALAAAVASASAVLAAGVTLALDTPSEQDIPLVFGAGVMAAVVACPLGLPILLAWLTGWLVRRRRAGIESREHDAVAASTAQALWVAGLERARVAAGLRAAVLRDTARVATAADAGDLDQVLTSARAALDAMRGLLNGLREEASGPARGDHEPQPTAAALPALAERWRAGGRAVALEVRGAGRVLPADVDLSAFRVVELLLAGDTGPVAVRVDLDDDPVRIGVRPMPADAGGEIAAGLRARLAAVGGSTTTAADGLPEILLPGTVPPHPDGIRPDAARESGRGRPAGEQGRAAGSDPGRPAGRNEEVASSPSA